METAMARRRFYSLKPNPVVTESSILEVSVDIEANSFFFPPLFPGIWVAPKVPLRQSPQSF
jgi:hypothetical protein